AALLTSGVPTVRIDIDVIDEYSLGQLFMFYQFIVPIIGLAANINPFDQPGVEEAKEYAYGMMMRKGFEAKKQQFESIYKKSDEFIL
ncbi:MAG: glucose-6-phosphate isomerase, partial [Deferribacterales bacterium]|nr:glucose-6-phosphate isomerase [Deferribacterales bacterium]